MLPIYLDMEPFRFAYISVACISKVFIFCVNSKAVSNPYSYIVGGMAISFLYLASKLGVT